ncbi:MAG: glycogen debranching enzyme, partial [Methylovulum sp.]|nr:glycogen debranching enzyme [Methylovulum sp.]
LYQVGSFPGYRWGEWNGRYRDSVRRFLRGDKGMISELATRVCGSSDLYEPHGRLPISSINFVTCHDGFTLHDLFSYNQKHNEANGENNQDGCNNSLSYNCGAEGETNNPAILALRRKQAKNALAILLLSQGVPMLLAGDEFMHSQGGNNNGYCQDNGLSWLDWELAEKNADLVHFVQQMIALRKRHKAIMRRHFLTGKPTGDRLLPDIIWHWQNPGGQPGWDDPKAQLLRYTLTGVDAHDSDLHVVMNMADEAVQIKLPVIKGRVWRLAVDTSLAAPNDIIPPKDQKQANKPTYQVAGRSVVVFENA